VLAIAAAKLGFDPVLAIDSEQAAIEETERNARLNYVEFETKRLDLRNESPPAADVVTANLTTGLLEQLAARWSAGGAAPKRLIASGFLASESERVRTSFERAGIETVKELERGEWAALLGQVP
jgi:ribosomal protein L11 methyltransferase